MDKKNLKNCTLDELKEWLVVIGEPSYRGKQIFQWIQKGINEIDEITNLSKDLRSKLKAKAYIGRLSIAETLTSKIDGTRKYLFMLQDENIIEGVLMKYEHGNTVCVSCQVGCRMGCNFCASTLGGVIRNLTSGEILDQVLAIQKDTGERVSNVVLMGSGEPLDNYNEVIKFLEMINHPEGLNISLRNITISTCGIVPKIIDLAKKKLPITLAISLHAPNDKIRGQMMPINKKYGIDDIIQACGVYIQETNRRITFEYALIDGVNDSKAHAEELAQRLKQLLCHVNLIPLNKVSEREYEPTRDDKVKLFKNTLKRRGIQATVRRELGSDINAACGQLRRRYLKDKENENKI